MGAQDDLVIIMTADESAAAGEIDPLRELASKIYIELVGRAYGEAGAPDHARPQPLVLAQMSFKFAEAFYAADEKVNPRTIAARSAAAKADVKLSDVKMDFMR